MSRARANAAFSRSRPYPPSKIRALRQMRSPRLPRLPVPRSQFAAGDEARFTSEVLRLVNQERTSRGLRPLVALIRTIRLGRFGRIRTDQLSGIARVKAADMRDRNYFSHTSPTLGTPGEMLTRYGVNWTAYGENIAAGQTTPQAVMTGWMNSPGHRANILNPNFTHLGVGYVPGVTGSQYRHYWVQLFVRL
ncbi:putative YkwD family protein [Paenibacillus mucilaginosus]|uniref:CAP domain-containing protein n=1 Tax=Paenibacillus mucilaginosus TaxID=61624 RepID=UPI003D237D40